jgi:AGZA family xanthine/uracil permease-like MFS transporter
VAVSFGSELAIYGMIALSQGAILISMVWAAALAWVFDRYFLRAAAWMAVASVLSCLGLIHAYTLSPEGVENKLGLFAAPEFAVSYGAAALLLVGCHFYVRKARKPWLGAELDL